MFFYKILQQKKTFFYSYLIFLGIAFVLLLCSSNQALFLTINQSHSKILDDVFLASTRLGDGVVAIFIIFILFAIRTKKDGLFLLLSFIFSSSITQFLKRFVFNDILRPASVFSNTKTLLHFVEGESMAYYHSFPSGHSTVAFCIASALALLSKQPIFQFFFFLYALLSAYSRIYLAQHFPLDIVVGSLIGTLCTLLVYYWINKDSFFLNKKHSLD